jgi:hypothetical protein
MNTKVVPVCPCNLLLPEEKFREIGSPSLPVLVNHIL